MVCSIMEYDISISNPFTTVYIGNVDYYAYRSIIVTCICLLHVNMSSTLTNSQCTTGRITGIIIDSGTIRILCGYNISICIVEYNIHQCCNTVRYACCTYRVSIIIECYTTLWYVTTSYPLIACIINYSSCDCRCLDTNIGCNLIYTCNCRYLNSIDSSGCTVLIIVVIIECYGNLLSVGCSNRISVLGHIAGTIQNYKIIITIITEGNITMVYRITAVTVCNAYA